MKKYRASKLVVKIVSKEEERDFENKYHKQGYVPSEVCYGLCDGDVLLQVMSFRKPYIEMQNKNPQHQWECARECSASDVVILGGKSRLLKHFVEDYDVLSVISYCSRSLGFDGHSYISCGFDMVSSGKSYHYEKDGQIIQRFKMQKNSRLRREGKKEPIQKTIESFGGVYDPHESESKNARVNGFVFVEDLGNVTFSKLYRRNIGYIYEMEYKGKIYRGQHTVVREGIRNTKPYYGSGVSWRDYLGDNRPERITVLEWVGSDEEDEYSKIITEKEYQYINEVFGEKNCCNLSNNPFNASSSPIYSHDEASIKKAIKSRRKIFSDPEFKKEWSRKQREGVQKAMEDQNVVMRHIEGCKKTWKNPEYREKWLKSIRESRSSKEFKDKISKATKKRLEDPEERKRLSEMMKRVWKDPEYRKNHTMKTIKHYIRCIETGEINTSTYWREKGFTTVLYVCKGRFKQCKGYHFEYVD